LVEKLIEAWDLKPNDRILDPFVGAGTTLVVAKDHGIPAVGLDVLPLSALVSRVKTADYHADELVAAWQRVRSRMPKVPPKVPPPAFPLLKRAFTHNARCWLAALRDSILSVQERSCREFLQVAYLRAMREVCRARSDGGWLRWTRRRPSGDDLLERMDRIVGAMVTDVRTRSRRRVSNGRWEVIQGDARFPPNDLGTFSAVICSPPYPNRHDYSRVFAPELLLAFCDEEQLKQLRYRSFRSHVEARAPDLPLNGYSPPPMFVEMLGQLSKAPVTDRRVVPMIEGYFRDTFEMLKALRPYLRRRARLAFVVGNVRHAGIMIHADEMFAQLGEQAGYQRDGTWVIRFRGNSAQQMGHFGREPARESVVFLKK
jgi:hypothetical protein